MHIKTDYSLSNYNTFQLSAVADYFVDVGSFEDIKSLTDNKKFVESDKLILGGGSNILFAKDFKGIVIHPKFIGIEKMDEDATHVILKVGSGVVWDDFVKYAVENNLGGIENLSKIPGNVGAAPVQNIGAYGVEVKDVIEKVEGYFLNEGRKGEFSKIACGFGYRNSIFKQAHKNKFLITHVFFRLSKPPHTLHTDYGIIEEKLKSFQERTIKTVREAVIYIRDMKLPDPDEMGNAGSFFKNPVVDSEAFNSLKKQHADIPSYPAGKGKEKLSAAWLIDRAGCKGIRIGNAGTHEQQPLVIVNFGAASGKEIIELSEYIQKQVREKFSVDLEPEVNIV